MKASLYISDTVIQLSELSAKINANLSDVRNMDDRARELADADELGAGAVSRAIEDYNLLVKTGIELMTDLDTILKTAPSPDDLAGEVGKIIRDNADTVETMLAHIRLALMSLLAK